MALQQQKSKTCNYSLPIFVYCNALVLIGDLLGKVVLICDTFLNDFGQKHEMAKESSDQHFKYYSK